MCFLQVVIKFQQVGLRVHHLIKALDVSALRIEEVVVDGNQIVARNSADIEFLQRIFEYLLVEFQ
jgi:hypothetical protein